MTKHLTLYVDGAYVVGGQLVPSDFYCSAFARGIAEIVDIATTGKKLVYRKWDPVTPESVITLVAQDYGPIATLLATPAQASTWTADEIRSRILATLEEMGDTSDCPTPEQVAFRRSRPGALFAG